MAIGALLSWGFGDFFIQRTARRIGDWKAIFFVAAVGALMIPFFIKSGEWAALFELKSLLILSVTTVVVFVTALGNFEALRRGKMAVVEPILSLELLITVALSMIFLGERLGLLQSFLVAATFVGILLVVTVERSHLKYHKYILERGSALALGAMVGMALVNFLVALSSRAASPLLTIWFTHTGIAVLTLVYLLARGRAGEILPNLKSYSGTIIAESVLDNAAWIFYAFAATLLPISIATTVSESYIILAVLLGVVFNREKLQKHQLTGIIIVILTVLALSAVV